MILSIEFNNKFILQFLVLDTPVAQLWLERMALRDRYPLDHPDRFYGFNSYQDEVDRALAMINNCISTINGHDPIISKSLNDINDQDTLNYLHNIFERYHGLLDDQSSKYWRLAPDQVRRALAELNLAVHRCESVARGSHPRFVCTWYGLPKTQTLTDKLIQECGTVSPAWGSVCLNYAEIGKTLEALSADKDNYIADEAFKPFNHYSADFVVRFYEDSVNRIAQRAIDITEYYQAHKDFFEQRGYTNIAHPRLMPLRFPVAELIETQPREQILEQVRENQLVTRVELG
jgi:hypothetical protein